MIEQGEDCLVKDGTLDLHGNPADKKKTGNWKACIFILGMAFTLQILGDFFFLQLPKPDIIKLCCNSVRE